MGEKREKPRVERVHFRVDPSGQLGLFAGCLALAALEAGAEAEKPGEDKPAEDKLRIRFVNPDPARIVIGSRNLRDHLEAVGQAQVFELRDLIQAADYSEFETAYRPGGRPPYHPAVMMGLVSLGVGKGCTSLRDLETLAKTDLRAMWMTGGIGPDHSAIGKFLNRHAEAIQRDLFVELTAKVVEAVGGDVESLAGDGTTVQAAGTRLRALSQEAAREEAEAAREEANRLPSNPKIEKKAELAEKALEEVTERAEARRKKGRDPEKAQVCPTEPEAPIVEQKRGGYAPSYTPSVVANKQRVIVGNSVLPSGETKQVEGLLEQADAVADHAGLARPQQLMLDAGYFCLAVILLALQRHLDLLCPEGRTIGNGSWKKKSSKQIPKSSFEFDDQNGVYVCPAGQRLELLDRDRKGENLGKYGNAHCAGCSMRPRCTRSELGRTVVRAKGDAEREAQRAVMEQPLARQEYRKRQAMVEPVFSVLRGRQRLVRFGRRGLKGVKLEFSLHAIAYNLNLGAKALARAA